MSFGKYLPVLLLLVLAFSAVVVFTQSRPAVTPAIVTEPVVPPVNSEPVSQPPAAVAFQDTPAPATGSAVVLAWVGNGAAPGKHSASAPGQLALLDASGAVTPLLDLPQGTSRVFNCGASPDGLQVAAYIGGNDNGALYLMNGIAVPVKVDDVEALGCFGTGQVQFSADGTRLGYIAYEPGAGQSEFADGLLRMVETASLSRVFDAENVTAFDMTADGLVYVSFFTNDKNEADEAAVVVWNGKAEREVVTLTPTEEKCRFVSGQIAAIPDGRLLVMMGQRCKVGETRTQWQLYVVDPAAGGASLAASDYQPGLFAPYALTNTMTFAPDGSRAYFTIPDGITAHTVGVRATNLSDFSMANVIEKQAVMANFGGMPNAAPLMSADGRWFAVVVTSPNNENTLNIIDLSNPSVAPITMSAGSRNDVVSALAFSPNGSRLFAIAGGVDSANNSLFSVDLTSGSSTRIARGRFGVALAVLADNVNVAVTDWQIPDDPKEPAYLNTVVINADTSEVANWYTGADMVDGKVTNQRFAHPMLWRQP
ncbi:MAG TPA: hypothetical protein VHO69_03880 [Phototrophicaceae bacterium]|nr:hypothetical protein [Phototrophicaceae bacterium]